MPGFPLKLAKRLLRRKVNWRSSFGVHARQLTKRFRLTSFASPIQFLQFYSQEARHSTDGTSPSPEVTNKSPDDSKKSEKSSSSSGGSKLAERAKKKAWYNVIYPTYKSRSEDFKKLFSVPDDERLVVGESNAHVYPIRTLRDKVQLKTMRECLCECAALAQVFLRLITENRFSNRWFTDTCVDVSTRSKNRFFFLLCKCKLVDGEENCACRAEIGSDVHSAKGARDRQNEISLVVINNPSKERVKLSARLVHPKADNRQAQGLAYSVSCDELWCGRKWDDGNRISDCERR